MTPEDAVRQALRHEEGPIAVAFSGGLDSSALLHAVVMAVGRERVLAVHVDHRVRPDSAQDAAFAREAARALGVSFRLCQIELPDSNVQANARTARYAAIGRAAASASADMILTAHHADDAVESALERMTRGSGVSAVAGLRHEATILGLRVLRPFLDLSRPAIHEWAVERGVAWREDPSNETAAYRRNIIRNELIPGLAQERGAEPLRRTVANMRNEASLLEGAVDNLLEAALVDGGTRRSVRLARRWLTTADPTMARLVLLRAVDSLAIRLDLAHLTLIESAEPKNVIWIDLPGGQVSVSKEFVTFHEQPTPVEEAPVVSIVLRDEPTGALPWFDHVMTWGTSSQSEHLRIPEGATIQVGGPRPGAAVESGGHRHKVTEILRAAGVTVEDRWRWPCIYLNGVCLAVVGQRVTDVEFGDSVLAIGFGTRAKRGMTG